MEKFEDALVTSILAEESKHIGKAMPAPSLELSGSIRDLYAKTETDLMATCKVSVMHEDPSLSRVVNFHPVRGLTLAEGTDSKHWSEVPEGELAKHAILLHRVRTTAPRVQAVAKAEVVQHAAAAEAQVKIEAAKPAKLRPKPFVGKKK